jgi:hypothetical protein
MGGQNKKVPKEIEYECVDWIRLAQDRGQWRALVDTVNDFTVPQKMEISSPGSSPDIICH